MMEHENRCDVDGWGTVDVAKLRRKRYVPRWGQGVKECHPTTVNHWFTENHPQIGAPGDPKEDPDAQANEQRKNCARTPHRRVESSSSPTRKVFLEDSFHHGTRPPPATVGYRLPVGTHDAPFRHWLEGESWNHNRTTTKDG
jgi:hypothetical protein